MSFILINNNSLHLDRTAMKRIRSHAATGKNKGKRISRPSRKDALKITTTTFRTPTIMGGISKATEQVLHIEPPIDDGISFPVPLTVGLKPLVKKVVSFMSAIRLSPELSKGIDYTRLSTPVCIQYMFVDEACFHSAMATTILYLNNMLSKPEGTVQAMRHLSQTFRLVNQKLSGQTAVTDMTLAVIISMAQHEGHQNQYQQGSVHVQGLRRIAELRGGVAQLNTSSSGLAQKMLRVDLEYSFQLGSPTLFTLEEVSIVCSTTTPFRTLCLPTDDEAHHLIFGQHPLNQLSADYRDLVDDILFFSSRMNNAIAGVVSKLDAIEFHNDVLLLGYRLIQLRPLGMSSGAARLQNRVHLGVAAFLITFLQGWDGRTPKNDLLSKLLLADIQQPPLPGSDNEELLLWLLFIGAASSCLWKDSAWISTTKNTINGLGITSWEGVMRILVKFPWVNAVHDAASQALWYKSNLAPSGPS